VIEIVRVQRECLFPVVPPVATKWTSSLCCGSGGRRIRQRLWWWWRARRLGSLRRLVCRGDTGAGNRSLQDVAGEGGGAGVGEFRTRDVGGPDGTPTAGPPRRNRKKHRSKTTSWRQRFPRKRSAQAGWCAPQGTANAGPSAALWGEAPTSRQGDARLGRRTAETTQPVGSIIVDRTRA